MSYDSETSVQTYNRLVASGWLPPETGIEVAAAERERCAKIAENWHPMLYAPEHGGSHPRDAAYRDAKHAIAKAIRE